MKKAKRATRMQYAALPYRRGEDGALEILVVTTRRSRRWIIPKGWPIKGLKPWESAAREAYEEAGVRGKAGARAIGSYEFEMRLEQDAKSVPCQMRVFPLLVKRQSITWPEAGSRDTRWVTPDEAARLIADPNMRRIVGEFADGPEPREEAPKKAGEKRHRSKG